MTIYAHIDLIIFLSRPVAYILPVELNLYFNIQHKFRFNFSMQHETLSRPLSTISSSRSPHRRNIIHDETVVAYREQDECSLGIYLST